MVEGWWSVPQPKSWWCLSLECLLSDVGTIRLRLIRMAFIVVLVKNIKLAAKKLGPSNQTIIWNMLPKWPRNGEQWFSHSPELNPNQHLWGELNTREMVRKPSNSWALESVTDDNFSKIPVTVPVSALWVVLKKIKALSPMTWTYLVEKEFWIKTEQIYNTLLSFLCFLCVCVWGGCSCLSNKLNTQIKLQYVYD